ncbi:MAG: hypothetical protein JWM36_4639 [Hyphomicrobiales bacterium]|nr:hypothetical protein [Hyphomicrobiales bacterium]
MAHYLFILRQNGEILREKTILVDPDGVLRKAVKFSRHMSTRGAKVIVKDPEGNVVCMIGTQCAASLREQHSDPSKIGPVEHNREQ